MVVVQMGQEYDVRWAFIQQAQGDAAAVALKKKDVVPEYWICEYADLPDVYKDGGMTDIVDFSQVV